MKSPPYVMNEVEDEVEIGSCLAKTHEGGNDNPGRSHEIRELGSRSVLSKA
jgi:hypothetical protein